MKYIKVGRADVASLPKATRVVKKPNARWAIEGHDGLWENYDPFCLYENLSAAYRDMCDRCGGIPVNDDTVIAQHGGRAYRFTPHDPNNLRTTAPLTEAVEAAKQANG